MNIGIHIIQKISSTIPYLINRRTELYVIWGLCLFKIGNVIDDNTCSNYSPDRKSFSFVFAVLMHLCIYCRASLTNSTSSQTPESPQAVAAVATGSLCSAMGGGKISQVYCVVCNYSCIALSASVQKDVGIQLNCYQPDF